MSVRRPACQDDGVPITVELARDPAAVDRILRSLPDWFGIEEAIAGYVTQAGEARDGSMSLLARVEGVADGDAVGVALVERHFPESAELTLIAVHAEHRGAGIGGRLVRAVEDALRRDGCRFLEVHTVGPSFEDPGYAATRAFYRRSGFAPMHEFDGLDWDGPTLIMIKALTGDAPI